MAYKIPLSNEQKEYIYNETDCKNRQNKIKSIWSYLIKYEGKGKSTNRLYCMYVLYHPTISKSYFYEIVNFINSYNEKSETKSETKSEIEKPIETIENKEFEPTQNSCKNKDKVNNYTNTLYTNEVCSPVELICKAMELLKDLNIKSRVVMEKVFEKLKKCNNIQRAGMIEYILVVIREKQKQNEIHRENYRKNKPYEPKPLRFNNCVSRNYSNDDYKTLEHKLLGWQ